MTPDMALKLKRSLVLHESRENFPYIDTVGKITIGIGYNLSDRGIDDAWIDTQYQADVNFFLSKFSEFDWWDMLNTDRQIVLIDMAFMGWKKFLEFEKLIDALAAGDYDAAAREMLNSEWAQQVKGRATLLSNAMLTGVYNV